MNGLPGLFLGVAFYDYAVDARCVELVERGIEAAGVAVCLSGKVDAMQPAGAIAVGKRAAIEAAAGEPADLHSLPEPLADTLRAGSHYLQLSPWSVVLRQEAWRAAGRRPAARSSNGAAKSGFNRRAGNWPGSEDPRQLVGEIEHGRLDAAVAAATIENQIDRIPKAGSHMGCGRW